MKVFKTLEKAYIERNANILKEFARFQDKGKTTREIYPILQSNLECSKGLIHALVYTPGYPYRDEAHEFIKEELIKMESEGKAVSQALAKLVGYEPQLSTNVPNC